MATIIKIKRYRVIGVSGLEQGELVTFTIHQTLAQVVQLVMVYDYSLEITHQHQTAIEIGGQYYKLLLDHTHGALTGFHLV